MTKAVHQISVTVSVGDLDLAIAWGERLLQNGIKDNGCRTATIEQDVASLKRTVEKARNGSDKAGEHKEAEWTLTMEDLAGETCAVLREPEKMDYSVPITEQQQAWLNALKNLMRGETWPRQEKVRGQ